jgi:hypothetical protein
MRNTWLTMGYFAVIGLVVAFRKSFLHNNWAVMAVSGGVLFLGLALWVYIAQSHRR